MKSLEEIESILSDHKRGLRERFKVKEIGIFGSYARNEQTEDSDVDILVEFEEDHKTFDNYIGLRFFLEEVLRLKVDLVLKNAVRREIKERIFSEAIYV